MNTSRRSTRPEFALCLILIAASILVWIGFISFLHATSTEGAAFRFMASHLRLGESPEFVLQIAGEGLPQSYEVLLHRREFWGSMAVLIVFTAALGWLAARLRGEKPTPNRNGFPSSIGTDG